MAGPIDGQGTAPPVRLVREWKGLTVADLLRDEIVERLPGQVRDVLHHIERRDFAAAERALPGEGAPVLPGPRRPPRSRRSVVVVLVVAAITVAAAAATWFRG